MSAFRALWGAGGTVRVPGGEGRGGDLRCSPRPPPASSAALCAPVRRFACDLPSGVFHGHRRSRPASQDCRGRIPGEGRQPGGLTPASRPPRARAQASRRGLPKQVHLDQELTRRGSPSEIPQGSVKGSTRRARFIISLVRSSGQKPLPLASSELSAATLSLSPASRA